MPTSPTCDVARNIDVGEKARLVTGDDTTKQSTSLQHIAVTLLYTVSQKNQATFLIAP